MKALPLPVGRYRRILPALTTNQNAGFVTMPSENKINIFILLILDFGKRKQISPLSQE